mgnify:CR=1 FL=1
MPLAAFLITEIMPLDEPVQIGLILPSAAAGAPFLPKLAATAKGNLAFSVGLMVLLMVVTVGFAPIVLPLLIPGVAVNPWDIARPLITIMLIPLAIGLFVKAWTPDMAGSLAPIMNQTSGSSLIAMGVLVLLVGYQELLAAVGTGAFVAATLMIGGALLTGLLLSSGGSANLSVMGLGTGQRNISAALLVATTNFTDPEVILTVLVGSVVGLVILFLAAGTLGKRAAPT